MNDLQSGDPAPEKINFILPVTGLSLTVHQNQCSNRSCTYYGMANSILKCFLFDKELQNVYTTF